MHDVPHYVTYLFAGLLVIMVMGLALEEKLHAKKSIITGVVGVITLFLAVLLIPGITHSDHAGGHMPFYIPFVDWEVVLIILGSSLFVDVVSKSGMFSWIAIKLTKFSGGDPVRLLIYYSALTVIFSAVLNNVTAMIIIGSLSAVSLKRLKRDEMLLGFLMVEGLLTNIGGLLTLISSVPNIIVGQTAGISFMTFFVTASPYVLVGTIITIFMGMKIFKITGLKTDEEKAESARLLKSFDENDQIESKSFFIFSFVMFTLLIVFFSTQSILPVLKDIGLGYVAIAMGWLVLIKYKHDVDKNYRALDWDLLFFFMFLFAIIGVMKYAGVLKMIGGGVASLIALPDPAGPMALLWSSAILSSVTDNIPLAAVLANILKTLGTPESSTLWWSVIFGANLGGNITPIGSASTVVAVTIIHKYKLEMSFVKFVKTAVPFAFIQLVVASGYVLLLAFLK